MRKFIIYTVFAFIVVIGGYWLLAEYNEKQFIKEVRSETVKFVKRNYQDVNEVTIDEDSLFFYPSDLGGFSIDAIVNGDDKLGISISFELENNQIGKVISVEESENFPPEKDDCVKDFCED